MKTSTAVRPSGRFGLLDIQVDNKITSFKEKADSESSWVNGGFMVVDKEIFEFIHDSSDILEKDVLSKLASNKSLNAFKHNGFWQSMDTLRDKELLENLISPDKTPWIQKND
jgi:glucose-1-phosphate cytidylyltransferase